MSYGLCLPVRSASRRRELGCECECVARVEDDELENMNVELFGNGTTE
jgi:hypothetical protein